MTGFDLIPVDGGDPVHLPPGETVIGRGPFLSVNDTRVSRHHGLLQNLNGQLRLKPTHVNPCFVQSSLSSDPRPLENGSWHQLHHGDLFSLLPGRFIYRVEAVGRETYTHRNFKEQEELPVCAGPDVEQEHTSSPSALSSDEADRQKESTQQLDDQSSVAPPPPRRRVLPVWMMTAVMKIQPAVKKSKAVASPATEATPTSLPGEAELHEEEEEKPEKTRTKMNEEEIFQSEAESRVRAQRKRSRSQVNDESDNNTKKTGNSSSQMSQISQSAHGGTTSSKLRTPCPYGTDCYRKNPLHFQECSHPGDTDYEEETDRPECPFGTDCYRKNPLHRKQFKHTKKPVHQNVAQNPPEEDEDSGDEDNFINDDSEAAEDDSDYVPLASDDSEQEDVQRLQREAKAFLKKTK